MVQINLNIFKLAFYAVKLALHDCAAFRPARIKRLYTGHVETGQDQPEAPVRPIRPAAHVAALAVINRAAAICVAKHTIVVCGVRPGVGSPFTATPGEYNMERFRGQRARVV